LQTSATQPRPKEENAVKQNMTAMLYKYSGLYCDS